MSCFAVYRMSDGEGTLLYVGVSTAVARRIGAHAGKDWFADVRVITIEPFDTRAEAYAAEFQAINAERPSHNVSGLRPELQAFESEPEFGRGSRRILQPHGTLAALRRHERAREEPCPACALVRTEKSRQSQARYRARRKAEAAKQSEAS